MTRAGSDAHVVVRPGHDVRVALRVDGRDVAAEVDVRTTVLDLLRERLGVRSPKKGCDHGQCGSCTVLLDGRRHLTCLALAVAHDGAEVTTAAGLGGLVGAGAGAGSASGDDGDVGPPLHPVQEAFLAHDGYQCGYCTPGQVCSAAGLLDEVEQAQPSHVTDDLSTGVGLDGLDAEEIAERMSGNLCRCGAYAGIRAAVAQAATERATASATEGARPA